MQVQEDWQEVFLCTLSQFFLLDFFLNYFVCETGCMLYNEVSLVPRRVIPHVLFQQRVRKLKLTIPDVERLQTAK